MQTTTADVPDSAKLEPLAQPDLEYQNQHAGTFAQSDSQEQSTEMIDKEERNDLILKWTTFLLFLTVPLFIVVVSFLPLRILCANPKLITFASSGTASWVYGTLHMMLEEKWQADLLIAGMDLHARRIKYSFMIIVATLGGGTANLLWPLCTASGP